MRLKPSTLSRIFLLGLFLTTAANLEAAETVNRIIAVVNDEVITAADVETFMQALQDDPQGGLPEKTDVQDMQRAILQRLIDQHLLLQEARHLEVTVESAKVLERYDQFRNKMGNDALFHQSLAEAGLSEEQLKNKIRDQFLVQRVIDLKVRSKVVVSPQDVSLELSKHPELAKPGERIRVSHLLIRVNDQRTEPEAKKLIDQIHDQLAKGADFAALARQYSEDQHRNDGGVMGWVASGELMPELDTVIERLSPGQVSEPIQTRLGFHLVRVEERKAASSLSVMEANQAVYEKLYQQRFQELFIKWLDELHSKAYIQITDQG